jgi:hypothetical protein
VAAAAAAGNPGNLTPFRGSGFCLTLYGKVLLVLAGGKDASVVAGCGNAVGTVGASSLCPRSPA